MEQLNVKKWLLASWGVFVTISALWIAYSFFSDTTLHVTLIGRTTWEEGLPIRRGADMRALSWVFWLSCAVYSFLFTYVYTKGYEAKARPALEGLRYGLLAGCLMYLPAALINYMVFTYPAAVSVVFCARDVFFALVCGVVAGLIYRAK